ncbi:MAG: cardiolipin synthase ClsB [Rhizobacter sp.]|nr:cardiolipin synthase ClsB [Burkholderiales bacterium]
MQTFIGGNSVTLLRNGEEYFPALISAIERATCSVYIETYIFADDRSGASVADALVAAAVRGADVRVLVDSFGTKPYMTRALAQRLRASGVLLVLYRQDVFPVTWGRARLRRLHRKLVVIDGRFAFVGGINIIDDMNTPGQTPPRIDFAVRVEGPILLPITTAVMRLWRVLRIAQLDSPMLAPLELAPAVQPCGAVKAKFVVRDNLRFRRQIELAYLAALRIARTEVVIANAYFLPGIRFRRALIDAVSRGANVTLILQARVEFRLLRYATRALYGQLLAGGVNIVEYDRSFLHAKVAVVDRSWATVGSSNIDPFSLLWSREANVFVRDVEFASELRRELATLEENGGHRVDPKTWARRGLTERILNWCAYGLARAMTGLLGASTSRW